MKANNRRQLARVRNAFLGATALAGVTALATPASAIVINDGFTPAQAVDTTDITGVGQMVIDLQNGFIGLCTASLINPRTVIFASHCVNENADENAFKDATTYGAKFGGSPIGFFFNANNNVAGNSAIGHWLNGVNGGPKYQTDVANHAYNSNFVTYNTNCCTIGVGNNFLQSDIAMAALDTPAVGIPTWTLLFSPLSAPAHATIVGYGDNGIGSTGQGTIDFKRRVAENIISVLGSLDDQDTFLFGAPDGLPANLYMVDFNDPKFNTAQANQFDFNIFHDVALPREGITAPGDSGGPLIVDHQFGAPTIAAVLSGGDRFFNAQKGASYGTTSFYQPLYLYWDWIVANNPYKYVGNKAGNGQWTDPSHWQVNLDPAYLVSDGNGHLVNGLPTTAAKGETDVPPGFGTICYFNDCVDITTGAENHNTPPATPGPFSGSNPTVTSSGSNGGPAVVSDSTIDGSNPASQPATASGPSGSTLSPSDTTPSDWTNPENTGVVDGKVIVGLPGTTLTQVPNDTDGNPTTGAPARYFDVTLAADGITTLSGADITIDKLTVNGNATQLTIAAGASLTTLIEVDSFSGITQVDGTLTSANGVNISGGVLSGTGSIDGPGGVGVLIGAIAPGTVGTVGTLTINGPLGLLAGSTTVIDGGHATHDVLQVNGPALVGGTFFLQSDNTLRYGDSFAFLNAQSITSANATNGGYDAVLDTLPGVLRPVVTTVTTANGQSDVVSIVADTFAGQLAGTGSADQNQVAAALDALRAAHYNDLAPLYNAIDPLTGKALSASLEDLAPDAQRTASLVGDMEATAFDNMLYQHMGDLGPAGTHTAGLSVDSDGIKMALSQASGSSFQSQQLLAFGQSISTNPGGGNQAVQTTGTGAAASPSPADGMWLPGGASVFLTGSAIQGSVAVGGGGGRADVRGMVLAAGADMPVGDGFTLGASIAYSDLLAGLRTQTGSLQSDSIQGAIYGRYDFGDNFIAEAFGAYGHQTMTTRRGVGVGGTVFFLEGHTGGDTPSVGGYIGRSFHLDTINGAPLTLTPSFSMTYLSSEVDPFTEVGGAPALTFADYSESSFASRLGIDAKMYFDVFDIHLMPNLHLAWVDNFEGTNSSIQAAFAAAPAAVMTFAMASRDRSYGEMGVGLDADLGDFMGTEAILSGRYDGNTRDDVNYGAWTGRLTIKF